MQESSARQKFHRGYGLAQRLWTEVRDFEASGAYTLRTESEPDGDDIHYTCFAVENQPPGVKWPLIAGDAIHNLRGAIDHALWAATPPAHRSKSTQFPIAETAAKFNRSRIKGLDAKLSRFVEETQPYNVMPDGPKFDSLLIMNELSNLDKHRALSTVATIAETPMVFVKGPAEAQKRFKFTSPGRGTPLADGTKVMSFRAASTETHNPQLGYVVTLEGTRLVDTLRGIVNRAYEILVTLETGKGVWGENAYGRYPLAGSYPVEHLVALDESYL